MSNRDFSLLQIGYIIKEEILIALFIGSGEYFLVGAVIEPFLS